MKIDATGTCSNHCFNCGWTSSYTPGKPLYPKFQKLLLWLGVDEYTLSKLKLESLRDLDDAHAPKDTKVHRGIKAIEMPECELIASSIDTHKASVEFLKSRGFEPDDYPFLATSHPELRNRVIVPFITHDTIVGYSARSLRAVDKTRYIMRTTTDFVFGMEFVQSEWEWVVLQEGIFDALSIRGLACMHNEISDAQAEMVNSLRKRVIVVPDIDKAGLASRDNTLINTAIDYGWSVAFPEWNVKDVNAAYLKYGPLFTVQHILSTATSNLTSIKLRQKMLNNSLKKEKHGN